MKNIYSYFLLALLLVVNLQLSAQQTQPHVPQSPPLNPGYPVIRGMYVDCADEIIQDMSNGNVLNLQSELYDFIRKNYIRYIILCGLEHSNIFGNPSLEIFLRNFLMNTRRIFPTIQIGISGSDSGTFQSTAALFLPQQFATNCFPAGTINNINDFNNALNNVGPNSVNLKKSELCKFFYYAAKFGTDSIPYEYSTHCKATFDAFYLEYRYWNQTSSLSVMQNEFSNYKTILSFLQVLKCNYSCVRNIDAEFLPTEMYNLQAWTAIDQITDADFLVDRLIIPSFTNSAPNVYNQICKTLHFLSDRFSKPNSKIFLELSAESNSFSYCNSSQTPHNYLGDYLNGISSPKGNMYSVEKLFLDKFNDTNYMCSSCSCFPYTDNHYTSTNASGNSLAGYMWKYYSMLLDHNLTRSRDIQGIDEIENKPVSIQLICLNGLILNNFKTTEDCIEWKNNHRLSKGIYFIKMIYSDGKQEVRKLPVY